MWLKVIKEWAVGLYSWDELLNRLPLPGKKLRAMGGLGCKKVACAISNSNGDQLGKVFIM